MKQPSRTLRGLYGLLLGLIGLALSGAAAPAAMAQQPRTGLWKFDVYHLNQPLPAIVNGFVAWATGGALTAMPVYNPATGQPVGGGYSGTAYLCASGNTIRAHHFRGDPRAEAWDIDFIVQAPATAVSSALFEVVMMPADFDVGISWWMTVKSPTGIEAYTTIPTGMAPLTQFQGWEWVETTAGVSYC